MTPLSSASRVQLYLFSIDSRSLISTNPATTTMASQDISTFFILAHLVQAMGVLRRSPPLARSICFLCFLCAVCFRLVLAAIDTGNQDIFTFCKLSHLVQAMGVLQRAPPLARSICFLCFLCAVCFRLVLAAVDTGLPCSLALPVLRIFPHSRFIRSYST